MSGLSWAPIDSTEAREIREAGLEQEAERSLLDDMHDTECVDGWLGEDEHGRVIPCERCRPHLVRQRPVS